MRPTFFQALSALPLLICLEAGAQANGKLQIHFMDVGQGDGAVLISPQGETVLFDDGVSKNCDKPLAYLQQIGVTKIDYHITSHYHSDHIGCAPQVFQEFPLKKVAYDRGHDYPSVVYRDYVQAAGNLRKTATDQTVITLDQGQVPVKISLVALNGNGVPTTNENDLSVVATVEFNGFRAEFGGDLSGDETNTYQDIETSVAPKVGKIDVYKVHHHCSSHSSNATWFSTVQPRIGIISTGTGNTYGHPAPDCLERLHKAGVKTYWTEVGAGATPEPDLDVVAGTVVVEVAPGAKEYTVTRSDQITDRYPFWDGGAAVVSTPAGATATAFAWSTKSSVYHYATCSYVASISPANLVRGGTAPDHKQLHKGCPK